MLVLFAVGCVALPRVVHATARHRALPTTKIPAHIHHVLFETVHYKGREQTYLKHFFLEKYLERVAYVIGFSHPEFVYVDGFSGPWKSENEAFEDTSFIIAINVLRRVRDGLAKKGKEPRIRCLFVEKDPQAFTALESAVQNVADLEITPLNGDFEALIPKILGFIGRSFSLGACPRTRKIMIPQKQTPYKSISYKQWFLQKAHSRTGS